MNPRPDLTTLHHFSITVPDVRDCVDGLKATLNCEVVELHDDWAFLRFANIFMAVLKTDGKHPPHIARVCGESGWAYLVGQGGYTPRRHRDGSESVYLETAIPNLALEFVRENSLTPALKLL